MGLGSRRTTCFATARAHYLASRNDGRFLSDFYRGLETDLGLERVLPADLPEGVTAQVRGDGTRERVFLMNFSDAPRTVDIDLSKARVLATSGDGSARLEPFGSLVLER